MTQAIPERRFVSFALIRRLHLWIGAWGAIAAILFGATGLIQNHRAVLKLPQGDSTDVGRIELPVPESARRTPDALRAWLRDQQHLAIDGQRTQPGRSAEFNGRNIPQPSHWMFTGGNARTALQADYATGADFLVVRTTQQSPLAVLSRLHKGVGGGLAWILLSDSFALAMVCLGISGLILWGRRRSPTQMVFSIVGLAVAVLLAICGAAVL